MKCHVSSTGPAERTMNERPSEKNGKGGFNPLTILKDAVRVVPAMKYALAGLGLVAVVAIMTLWRVR